MRNNVRVQGLMIALVGFAFSAFYWNYTIRQAQAHADSVVLSSGIVVFVAICLLGLALVIRGEALKRDLLGLKQRKKSWKDYALIACLIAPGVIVHHLLQGQLERYGYAPH